MIDKRDCIYIAGHTGLVGSAIYRELLKQGYFNSFGFHHSECDLSNTIETRMLFEERKPKYVFMAAALAGGIKKAIDYPAEMLERNILIQTNVIKQAFLSNVEKLIFIASSCVYPVDGEQPYTEDQIGTGRTDENWSYAIAKIAGSELCHAYHKQYGKNFLSVVPCNMYGPNDNFDKKYSHVIPALIRKCHEAKEDTVELWGDGEARREFLYSEDFAEACVDIMEKVDYDDINGVVNVGAEKQLRIADVFHIICSVLNKPLQAVYSGNTPGIASKLMSLERLHNVIDWQPKTVLSEGIRRSYDSFCSHC